jgi:hypothetical protein
MGRMASVSDVLFRDDDLASMYTLDNGRPSLPPSLLCGVLLLQFYDHVGDEEAVERVRFDLRWKVALALPLDFAGFDPTSLVVFRKRLLQNGKERYAFERFLSVARAAGFLPEKLRLLVDSSPQKGAGAVQDTYTLLRKGVRKLLKAMGFAVPEKRRGLTANRVPYLENDQKARIDWTAPGERKAELARLVADADAVLALAQEQADDPEVRTTGWLLTKILGDDVVKGADGQPQIGEGVARDRMMRWTDPTMRHGRKSASGRWNGAKIQVAEEPQSETTTADWREVQDPQGRAVTQFRFARSVCAACPLFERCVHSKTTGRTVTLHYHEGILRAARERQATPAFREQYRQRAVIERKIAEVMGQGLRQARYVGRKKHRLQAAGTVAVVNLKRLLTLAQHDPMGFREALAGRSPRAIAGMVS